MADKNKIQHEAMLSLEQAFLKVPYEQLKRAFKTSQKHIEKELLYLTSTLNEITRVVNLNEAQGLAVDINQVVGVLDNLQTRISILFEKLQESRNEETKFIKRCAIRQQHLVDLTNVTVIDSPEYKAWNRVRVDRVTVDYLLRKGMVTTATALAEKSGIVELVDIELFTQMLKIEEALRNRSCSECLQWYSESKSNLKKSKSTLEFNLRLQEFVEIIRRKEFNEAIKYSRKHLAPRLESHSKEVQVAMALLAFHSNTECPKYKQYFDDSRWDSLIAQFRKDLFALHNLTEEASLLLLLQAGLSALKTPQCYRIPDKTIKCPVCSEKSLGTLADKLPLSHHVNSCMVCRVTGEIMNENNPPMVFPNGMVYSRKGLQTLVEDYNVDGKQFKCPRSLTLFDTNQARKAFLT